MLVHSDYRHSLCEDTDVSIGAGQISLMKSGRLTTFGIKEIQNSSQSVASANACRIGVADRGHFGDIRKVSWAPDTVVEIRVLAEE